MFCNCITMKVLSFKDFINEWNLRNDTLNESQVQKDYNCPIYPRGSKIQSDKEFVNIDNGQM